MGTELMFDLVTGWPVIANQMVDVGGGVIPGYVLRGPLAKQVHYIPQGCLTDKPPEKAFDAPKGTYEAARQAVAAELE